MPYPAYGKLRDAGPVVWIGRYGVWAMARYKEVATTLNDWGHVHFRRQSGHSGPSQEQSLASAECRLESDPPLHDTTRGAISRVITGLAIRGLRDAFKREADRLAGVLIDRGTFDGVADFAASFR